MAKETNKENIANNFINYDYMNLIATKKYILIDTTFKALFPDKELEKRLDEYYKDKNEANHYLTIYDKDWIRYDEHYELSIHAFTPTNASGIYSMLGEVISELDELTHKFEKGLPVNHLRPIVLFCMQKDNKVFTETQKRFINFIGDYSNTVCISTLDQLVSFICKYNCNIKKFKMNGCK